MTYLFMRGVWKMCRCEPGQESSAHTNRSEFRHVVVEIEQELDECDGILLHPGVGFILHVIGLV